MPEPIELPPLVFEAMSTSDVFFELLGGWERLGPSYTKNLSFRDASGLIRKILPHMTLPRLPQHGQHYGGFWYDLGGWALEVYLRDRRYYPRTHQASIRLWVPTSGEDNPLKGTYVAHGMVYARWPGWSEV